MKKPVNLAALYAYLVCLVMLIAFIVCGASLVRSALNLMIPDPANSSYAPKPSYGDSVNIIIEPDAQALYDNTTTAMQQQVEINGIIAGLIQLAIIVPLYFYHWRLAERSRHLEQIEITIKDVYLFTGSFITLSVSVIAGLTAINTLTDLIFGTQIYLPSIESAFKGDWSQQQGNVVITKAQVQALIEETKKLYSIPRQTLISQFTALIIALPLFFWHWLIAKKKYATIDRQS